LEVEVEEKVVCVVDIGVRRRPGRYVTSGSCPDEPGIKRARYDDIGGSLDDSTAIGEDGNGKRAAAEAEEEVVGTKLLDLGVGAEAGAESGEVDGAMVLVDLDGVATAEGDVSAVLTGEMGEGPVAADLAAGARRAGGDLGAI
jgi:hypothetical protein